MGRYTDLDRIFEAYNKLLGQEKNLIEARKNLSVTLNTIGINRSADFFGKEQKIVKRNMIHGLSGLRLKMPRNDHDNCNACGRNLKSKEIERIGVSRIIYGGNGQEHKVPLLPRQKQELVENNFLYISSYEEFRNVRSELIKRIYKFSHIEELGKILDIEPNIFATWVKRMKLLNPRLSFHKTHTSRCPECSKPLW